MEMEHRTTYLATVGTLGPMIGLVGTVYGMIIAFRVIAVEGPTPQANQLASGISTALYATLEGIAISIPAIFFYALFRNRIARLSLEVGMTAEQLLEQFAPGVGTPTRNPGPARRTTPAAHAHPFAVSAALAAAATPARPHCRPPNKNATLWQPKPAINNVPSIKASDIERPQSQPDRVAGRRAPAHHFLHDARSLRNPFGRSNQGGALPLAPAALPGTELTFDRMYVAMNSRGQLLVKVACLISGRVDVLGDRSQGSPGRARDSRSRSHRR